MMCTHSDSSHSAFRLITESENRALARLHAPLRFHSARSVPSFANSLKHVLRPRKTHTKIATVRALAFEQSVQAYIDENEK